MVLRKMTGDEIAHGLDVWDSEYPPNAYQFRDSCRSGRQSKSHQVYKALPKPKADPAVAAKNIKAMRGVL